MDMMLSCKKASRLMSEALDRKLGMGERIALRFHTMMCSACSRVERQMALLRRAVSEFPAPEDAPGQSKPQ